jgi:hypothetical protein
MNQEKEMHYYLGINLECCENMMMGIVQDKGVSPTNCRGIN